MSSLGGANGADGPGGVALIDHDTFEVTRAWESDRGEQYFAYDVWWHLNDDVAASRPRRRAPDGARAAAGA